VLCSKDLTGFISVFNVVHRLRDLQSNQSVHSEQNQYFNISVHAFFCNITIPENSLLEKNSNFLNCSVKHAGYYLPFVFK